jgi:hypothetical protein
MYNLSPITMTKVTMATNDVAMQNMLLLIDNILPHKTCWKPRGRILIKTPKTFFCFNTWRTNLGRFMYLHWIEQRHNCQISTWQVHVVVMTCELLLTWQEYTFVKAYVDTSSKFVRGYSSWHGWNIIIIFFPTLAHRLMLLFTHSLNSNAWCFHVKGLCFNVWFIYSFLFIKVQLSFHSLWMSPWR